MSLSLSLSHTHTHIYKSNGVYVAPLITLFHKIPNGTFSSNISIGPHHLSPSPHQSHMYTPLPIFCPTNPITHPPPPSSRARPRQHHLNGIRCYHGKKIHCEEEEEEWTSIITRRR